MRDGVVRSTNLSPPTDGRAPACKIVVAELIRAEIADCGIISHVRLFLKFG